MSSSREIKLALARSELSRSTDRRDNLYRLGTQRSAIETAELSEVETQIEGLQTRIEALETEIARAPERQRAYELEKADAEAKAANFKAELASRLEASDFHIPAPTPLPLTLPKADPFRLHYENKVADGDARPKAIRARMLTAAKTMEKRGDKWQKLDAEKANELAQWYRHKAEHGFSGKPGPKNDPVAHVVHFVKSHAEHERVFQEGPVTVRIGPRKPHSLPPKTMAELASIVAAKLGLKTTADKMRERLKKRRAD